MKTYLGHVQINVKDPIASFMFYKQLFDYFEYKIVAEDKDYFGASNGTTDFWVMTMDEKYKKEPFHRKHVGLNHLCFRVDSKEDVDRFNNEFLKQKNVPTLYDTPKSFPEYAPDYYAVFFEDPDRIKLEVTYYAE